VSVAQGRVIFLDNTARIVADLPEETWPDIVDAQVRSLLAPLVDLRNPGRWEADVRVRLVDPGSSGRAIARAVAPGIVAVIAIDLPDRVMIPPREDLAGWGMRDEELFALGLANVRAEGAPVPQPLDVNETLTLSVFEEESFYTATHVLELDRLLPGLGPEGALAVVPSRHLIAAYPLRGALTASAIGPLINLAERLYEQAPGAISPRLYWWRAGELMLLPHERIGDDITFHPPAAFSEALLASG
jgi:hypothetical protein